MRVARFVLTFSAALPMLACAGEPEPHATPSGADPLAALPSSPAPEISLTGARLVEIADGDFVHPAFSPDGGELAYSGVVVEDGVELAEVLVHDLEANQRIRLLDSDASRRYAAYKSFVTGLEWKDADTLEAQVSDGDVDSTRVSFDVRSKRVISEEYGEAGDLLDPPALLDEAVAAFPSWRKEVLDQVLRHGYALGAGRFIAQKNHAGEDDHVWILELESERATPVLELPEGWAYSLGGAFAHGETIVFALRKQGEQAAHLLAYREGSVSRLAEVEAPSAARLRVKHASAERVIFLVQVGRSYEQGDNPLFVFEGDAAKRVADVDALYDVAIDPQGTRICYAVWVGGSRVLRASELRNWTGGDGSGGLTMRQEVRR